MVTKHVSRLGDESSELLNIKAHGTYAYHCAFEGLIYKVIQI
jgi:hypothetical protein